MRRIDTEHHAFIADDALGNHRDGAGAATDIQHALAGTQPRRVNQLFAKTPLAAKCYEPDQCIVTRGPGNPSVLMTHCFITSALYMSTDTLIRAITKNARSR